MKVLKGLTKPGLGLVAALVLCGGLTGEAAEQKDPLSMAISAVRANYVCFNDIQQLTAHIVAREEVLVRPEVEGLKIAQLMVEDGDTVSAGQALAQLKRPDYLPGSPTIVTINAPVAGTVMYRRASVGMPASARGEPLLRIIRDGALDASAEIPYARLARIKAGQKARIDAVGETDLPGTVQFVAPELDAQTQLGRARIALDGKSPLRPGAYAKASVEVGRSCGPAVPMSAILYGPQGSVVQVVRNNRVETRRVRVGLLTGKDVEIREGLAVGDIVVARAGAFLREGDLVRAFVEDVAEK
jgi:multidrug efflux pump subunit AcrA (membrane-fusion protein)